MRRFWRLFCYIGACQGFCIRRRQSWKVPTRLEMVVTTHPLPSSYDLSLPASLRGEAVRSALRSDRGVIVDFTNVVGVLRVEGRGTIDFLNHKLSTSFSSSKPLVKEACLLTARGRIVDRLLAPVLSQQEALLVTSPGHLGLFERLDPLIFPLDGVRLTDLTSHMRVLTVAATRKQVAQTLVSKNIVPFLDLSSSAFKFPKSPSECLRYTSSPSEGELLVVEHTFLPPCICHGYTLFISDRTVADRVWENIVAEDNVDGPVEIGLLEYDTLRIEGGQPGFGTEMTGDDNKSVKASPLELHFNSLVDDKGCYLGQEGVSSILKNKRGVPRLLYSVHFSNEDNSFFHQEEDEEYSSRESLVPNKTYLPKRGDELFVLGSNEQIRVGVLTSVAEHGGTGTDETVALALIRRADSVLTKMKELHLEISLDDNRAAGLVPIGKEYEEYPTSGILYPPPMDPLDGLEVVIGGTFTQGVLRVVPTRRLREGQNLLEQGPSLDNNEQTNNGSVMGFMSPDDDSLTAISQNGKKVDKNNNVVVDNNFDGIMDVVDDKGVTNEDAKIETAMQEADRKIQKMEMLKKRAQDALAARRRKKERVEPKDDDGREIGENGGEDEAARQTR